MQFKLNREQHFIKEMVKEFEKDMVSEYEHILISAIRYALGRRTYIVDITVNYIIKEIPKLSEKCKKIMIHDIEYPLDGYGDACDKKDWMRLLLKLKESMTEEKNNE